MQFNLDIAIVIGFLVINLVVGIFYSRGIKNIKEYAIGNRNFSTTVIAATIIATWIGGGFFSSAVSETYKDGLWHIVARFGDVLTLLIVGYIIAPRIREFFGMISVAEVMDYLYGKNVRLITSVASIVLSIGYVAVQIKVISTLFSHFFGLTGIYAVIASSTIITVYSAFGGIKAVTFTDVIQFLTFGVFIPVFALFVWNIFDSSVVVMDIFKTNTLFNYKKVFDYHDSKFYVALMLFLYFTIPGLDPATFQRILMAKSTHQVRQSFIVAAILCLFIGGMACFIGIILLSHNPGLDPENLVMYIVDNYSYPGLKGLTLVGIMAMVMSTADSYINSAAIIFAHDFCNIFKAKLVTNQLLLSRIFAIFSGITATVLTLTADSLFELLLLVGNFYTPLITMPLMLAILGFRTSARVALISIIIGALTVIIWRIYLQPQTGIDSIIPGTISNLLCMLITHYLFGEPGGWIMRKNRPKKSQSLSAHTFNKFFNRNSKIFYSSLIKHFQATKPRNEMNYIIFGVFSAASVTMAIFSLSKSIYDQYIYIINILQALALFISTIFICNKLWPSYFRKKYINLIWNISIFTSLSYISSFLVLISKFSQITLVIYILNLSVIGMLLSWQITLAMIIIGAVLTFYSYNLYILEPIAAELYDLKLRITYIIFMISSFMLAFLKPKQQYQQLTEEKNNHLNNQVDIKEKQAQEALALKGEFIRNVSHEYHAPMTGIISMADALYAGYQNLSDQQISSGLKTIYQSTLRLKSFDDNINTLSLLSKANYVLNKAELDLSDLLYSRLKLCRKLYEENKEDREFILDIDEGIIFNGDKNYLTQFLDNLIINSITYCKQGKITVALIKQTISKIELIIADEGIGIPQNELHDVFDPFMVSSRTRTPAGGRGVGLALCKRVIEVHGGEIKAESDGEKGATFKISLAAINTQE